MKAGTKQKMVQVKALYEDGRSLEEIASATGYKKSSVGTILNQLGIYRAPRVCDHMEQIIAMRDAGKTLNEISAETGFCVSRISKKLVEAGCRKQDYFADQEIDLKGATYAKPRRTQRCVIGGKTYIDIAPMIG